MSEYSSVLGYIGGTVFFTVTGQLLVKWGMLAVGPMPQERDQLLGFIWRAFANWGVFTGLACAGIAALFWILAMSKSDISFAYPFMGLAIVLVLALSPLLFQENVPLTRWLGVLVVCLGIWIASRA